MDESEQPVKETGATDYNKAVKEWMWQCQQWNNLVMFMCMPPPCMPQLSFAQQPTNTTPTAVAPVPVPAPAPIPADTPAGREYIVPSLWKRVLAEIIDFLILFIVKLGMTLIIVEYFGSPDFIKRYDIEVLFNEDITSEAVTSLTYELVAMEIVNRAMICVFETVCLHGGFAGVVGGATPGKRLMGLRVVACHRVVPITNISIQVFPSGNIGWYNAFTRSVIKNFSMAFFFPVCFTVYFFQHRRAAYDIIASCVVVEARVNE